MTFERAPNYTAIEIIIVDTHDALSEMAKFINIKIKNVSMFISIKTVFTFT